MSIAFENIIKKQLGRDTIKEGSQAAELVIQANTKFSALSAMFKLSAEQRGSRGDAYLDPRDVDGMLQAANDLVDKILLDHANEDVEELIKQKDFRVDKKTKINVRASGLLRLRRSGQMISGVNLVRMMNTMLYQYAQDRMGVGGQLINRTGRLAHSGTVTGVEQEGTDGLSFHFTYMLYPYQVFENDPGGMGDNGRRSPVALFDSAVTALAKELLNPNGLLDHDKIEAVHNPNIRTRLR